MNSLGNRDLASAASGKPVWIREVLAAEQALLQDFRDAFDRYARDSFNRILGSSPGPLRRWFLDPLVYTATHRTNFFRSALLLESVKLTNAVAAGPSLAACAEIGWTCALLLDDIIDRSTERQGMPCAHLRFGTLRCIIAAAMALVLIARELGWALPGAVRLRFCRVRLGTTLLFRCAAAQFKRKTISGISEYRSAARDVNSSIHWSLLSPHCGDATVPHLAQLRRYADHSAVAGKMRNDLLDYWGGSTERKAILEDLRRRERSFPVIVLLEEPLDACERLRILKHFRNADSLQAQDLFRLFRKYEIPRKCLSLLEAEIRQGEIAIENFSGDKRLFALHQFLLRWNRHMLDGCRARVLTDLPEAAKVEAASPPPSV
jgi:geranylgeranyl pyrophosphate synthase